MSADPTLVRTPRKKCCEDLENEFFTAVGREQRETGFGDQRPHFGHQM